MPTHRDPYPEIADGRVEWDLPCERCRYNLRTLGIEANCPECGHAVLETLTARQQRRDGPPITAARRVVLGVACLAAGVFTDIVLIINCCVDRALFGAWAPVSTTVGFALFWAGLGLFAIGPGGEQAFVAKRYIVVRRWLMAAFAIQFLLGGAMALLAPVLA